jgi:hypothetical protein
VTVHVEHRHEHEGYFRQYIACDLAFQQLARDKKPSVLAIDLARVNAALHHYDGPIAFLCGARIEHAVVRQRKRDHVSAFGRGAELETSNSFGVALLECLAQAFDFLVSAGSLESGLFRDRAQIGGERSCR